MNGSHGCTYQRPTWAAREFRDERGQAIPYGHRWGWLEGPPEWAYGTTSNLDRFSPLHAVADALMEYLVCAYEIFAVEDSGLVQLLPDEPPDFDRLVRLSPDSGGTPLTVVFTSFPGVVLYVGRKFPEAFPVCGCDACDDAVGDVVVELEERMFALPAEELRWARRDGRPQEPQPRP